MLAGCSDKKEVKRAVFAWNGVETEDRVILDKYQIDTVFMDINTYNEDGLDVVEENYKEQFTGTDVGIAFHNLDMMRKLDK